MKKTKVILNYVVDTLTGHQNCELTVSKERVRLELLECFDSRPFTEKTRVEKRAGAVWRADIKSTDSYFEKVQTMIREEIKSSGYPFDADVLISEILNCGVL